MGPVPGAIGATRDDGWGCRVRTAVAVQPTSQEPLVGGVALVWEEGGLSTPCALPFSLPSFTFPRRLPVTTGPLL